MEEREIDLLDMLAEILLRWRAVVLAMLIGAVALGGFSYLRSYHAAKGNTEQIEELEQLLATQSGDADDLDTADKKLLEEQLTPEQLLNVETILMNEGLYADKAEYYNNSIYMQIDANHVPRYEFTFLVKGSSPEETNRLVQAYEDAVFNGGMCEHVADEMNISSESARELVGLERSAYGQFLPVNTVRMYVCYTTEEGCRQLAQLVIDYIKSQQTVLAREMEPHTLTLLQQSYSTVTDTNLLSAQRSNQTDLLSLESAIIKGKSALTDAELQYYNLVTDNEANDEADDEETSAQESTIETQLAALHAAATPRISLKYVLLGMVLAAFLYVFVVALKYILDNKLRAADDIRELYGISKLGQIPKAPAPKRFLGFVDQWILAIRNRGKRSFSPEEAANLTAVAVRISAQKQGISTLYCIGCGLKGRALEFCNTLREQLAAENIELKVLNNVLYDAQALEELADAKGAMLVETAGATLYDEIAQELVLLARQEIPVIGGVVVE